MVLLPPRHIELYSTGKPRLFLKPVASVRRKLGQCLCTKAPHCLVQIDYRIWRQLGLRESGRRTAGEDRRGPLFGPLRFPAAHLFQAGLCFSLAHISNRGNRSYLLFSGMRCFLLPTVDGLAGNAN